MKAVVAAFNQEKALVGAFSVIVQPVVETMDRFEALIVTHRDLYSVTHAGRTLASLQFYVSGAASTAEDGLTSLYDTVSVCSVSPTSSAALQLCHPDLQQCHLAHWSTLSPDPKSEFPLHNI